MQRPISQLILQLLLMLVVLLLGLLFLHSPRFESSEDLFLHWLLKYSDPQGPAPSLTVVEIGHDNLMEREPAKEGDESSPHSGANVVSPMEFALFLQSVLEFKPTVVAFENILKWREPEKNQEQVFIDQAMQVPRLLLAAELTTTPDPDAPVTEMPIFTQVTGKKRGDLVEFSGIGRQANEEIRLIATTGFVNLPDEIYDGIHVPLLFRCRGDVIPSFALQAILLWLRISPREVAINLDDDGSYISLPHRPRIPIRTDGTLLISPIAGHKARHIPLKDLLVVAQQRDTGEKKDTELDSMRDQIVLARTPEDPAAPPEVFAATIATIQSGVYIRRVSQVFDCVILVLAAAAVVRLRYISRVTLVLVAIAFTAAYLLAAFAIVSRWLIWLPGFLPLGAVWLLVIASVLIPHRYRIGRELIAMSPPIP
jgi:hypothetical protein